MAKSDPIKASEDIERPVATPYELADLALRLAANKQPVLHWADAIKFLIPAYFLLDHAVVTLERGRENWPDHGLDFPPDEDEQLAKWKDFPGADQIIPPTTYPLSANKAAAMISGNGSAERREGFIKKAYERANGKMPTEKAMMSLRRKPIDCAKTFWEFARWLAPTCPRFKPDYPLKKKQKGT